MSDELIDMPMIEMPGIEEEQKPSSIEDNENCKSAFKWCFVGVGGAGGAIADAFWKIGFRRVFAVNTNAIDMNKLSMPKENKFLMDLGEGGAGKNPENGKKAAKKYREDIFDAMRKNFGSDFERIIVVAGAGCGTGTGGFEIVTEIAHDFAKANGKEEDGKETCVGCILTMPLKSEGAAVNKNAFELYKRVFELSGRKPDVNGVKDTSVGKRTLSPILIVDNEKVKNSYPNIAAAKFYDVANNTIAQMFYLFNHLAVSTGDVWTFDKADLKTLMDSGIVTFGVFPLKKWEEPTDISEAIRLNMRHSVMIDGFETNQSRVSVCAFVGKPEIVDSIKQETLEHGFKMLDRIMEQPAMVHRGLYRGSQNGLVIYTMMGELGIPMARMSEMKALAGLKGEDEQKKALGGAATNS